eukprot:g35246.t1
MAASPEKSLLKGSGWKGITQGQQQLDCGSTTAIDLTAEEDGPAAPHADQQERLGKVSQAQSVTDPAGSLNWKDNNDPCIKEPVTPINRKALKFALQPANTMLSFFTRQDSSAPSPVSAALSNPLAAATQSTQASTQSVTSAAPLSTPTALSTSPAAKTAPAKSQGKRKPASPPPRKKAKSHSAGMRPMISFFKPK